MNTNIANQITDLLCQLIEIPSHSKEECPASQHLERFIIEKGYRVNRHKNNIWVTNKKHKNGRPYLLLNSHIDTVKPGEGWQTHPYRAHRENGKIIGLGSNDAGGCLLSLLGAFLLAEDEMLDYNLVYATTAEEEISGFDGIESILPILPECFGGIIGEPTQMKMATAEKGLLVLDCVAHGKAGHAARSTGINAIDIALRDIVALQNFQLPQESTLLGAVKITTTCISAGSQHNVIPDRCSWVVDVRTNEHYSNQEVFEIIASKVQSEVTARSFRLNSSRINDNHPIVKAAKALGVETIGSPTTSDQAVIGHIPTVKMGPGDSNRSHTANEYIYESEIEEGIQSYLELLKAIKL